MNRRKTTPLIISIVAAVLGAVMLMMYARSKGSDKAALPPPEPQIEVWRVKQGVRIPKGQPVEAVFSDINPLVEKVSFPQKLVTEGMVKTKDEIPNSFALVDIGPGDPLKKSDFGSTEERARVEGIPSDRLRLVLTLPPENALGGNVKKGDRVAVIASFNESKDTNPDGTPVNADPSSSTSSTKVILRNMIVADAMPVGALVQQPTTATTVAGQAPAAAPVTNSTTFQITFAVTPEEAQKLVFAKGFGKELWLALDSDAVPLSGPAFDPQIATRSNVYDKTTAVAKAPLTDATTTTVAGAATDALTKPAAGSGVKPAAQPASAQPTTAPTAAKPAAPTTSKA